MGSPMASPTHAKKDAAQISLRGVGALQDLTLCSRTSNYCTFEHKSCVNLFPLICHTRASDSLVHCQSISVQARYTSRFAHPQLQAPYTGHLVIQRAAAGSVLYPSAGMGCSASFTLELMQCMCVCSNTSTCSYICAARSLWGPMLPSAAWSC